MRLPSVKDALLARLSIVRKRMHWYTIAILIWLTFYEIASLFLWNGIPIAQQAFSYGQYSQLGLLILTPILFTLSYILLALAIVGIIVHYSRGETSSRLRWGPLCGIAGAAAYFVGEFWFLYCRLPTVYQYYLSSTGGLAYQSSLQLGAIAVLGYYGFGGPMLVGIPSYIEYLIEGPPAKTERVTRAALAQRLSSALTWCIEELDDTIGQMRKRIRRDLTVLTIALPIVFIAPFYFLGPYISDSRLFDLLLATLYVFSAVFFLILALGFSSMLRRPRDAILALNHFDHFAAVAAAEKNALIKEARLRLAIFLLIFAYPALWWPIISVGYPYQQVEPTFLPLTVTFAVLMLSALACFLLGFRALTRSSVAVKALDTPGLLEPSIGILPAKVRAGEAHSVLINFNLAAEGTTSFARGLPVFDPGQQPYYEANLQAAGAIIDDDKRCAIFDDPCTNEDAWSISFPNKGTHALHLLLKAVRARSDGHEADRETLFAYVHNVLVEGWLTGSNNAISIIGVIVTAAGVLASALPFVVGHVP